MLWCQPIFARPFFTPAVGRCARVTFVTAAVIGACLFNRFGDVHLITFAAEEEIFATTTVTSSSPAKPHHPDETLSVAESVGSASVRSGEPFHKGTLVTPEGHIWQKWGPVATAIRDELDTVSVCSHTPDKCSSDAALKFLSIITEASKYEGRARIGQINRAVNLAVKYTTDARRHGIPDHWATPFETFESGQGDCEDYAIAKYALLRAMMWPANELRIVIVWDGRSRDYHAVEATHLGHAWLILDNASLIISEDVNVRNYHPLFIITESSVRQLRRPAAADEAKVMKWNKMN